MMKGSVEIIGGAAFRTFRNIWMLEELRVPYTHTPAAPQSKKARTVHPLGKVPVLRDGDFFMFESTAINTYLGDKFRGAPGVPVLVPPSGTTDRGRYEQVVSFVQSEIDAQGLWLHRKHEALAQHFGSEPGAVAHAKVHTQRAMKALGRELREREFLLGADFSAADICFAHCLSWSKGIGWSAWMEEEGAEVGAVLRGYAARCRAREGFQRARAVVQGEQEAAQQKLKEGQAEAGGGGAQ
eukprot:3366711-Rhodomonas_salina.1